MKVEIMDLIPWYANGTLSTADREYVESELNSHPAYRGELDFYQALRRKLQADTPTIDRAAGLADAMKRIREQPALVGEIGGNSAGRELRSHSGGLIAWWRGVFCEVSGSRLAYGVGAVVIAVQAAFISALLTREEPYSDLRSSAAVASSAGPFIKVNFKPDTREADVRFLLVGVGASIVGGPTQLGDYYLYLEAKRTDWAAQQLKSSPQVENVSVIATLPAAKE